MSGLSNPGQSAEGMAEPQYTSDPVFDIADEYRPEAPPPPQVPLWMDGSIRVGIHTSIAGDIAKSLDSARKLGCNAVQIFSLSPRMWSRGSGSRIAEADAARFRARRAELQLGPLVVHDNYLINLASADPILRVRSIQAAALPRRTRRASVPGAPSCSSGLWWSMTIT